MISRCGKSHCRQNILTLGPAPCTAMSCSPISHNYLAVAYSDSAVRIYDRRFLKLIDFPPQSPSAHPPQLSSFTEMHTRPVKTFSIPTNDKRSNFRITSVNYSSNEQDLLVSYSSDYLYLFDLSKEGVQHTRSIQKSGKNKSPQVLRRLRLRGEDN